MGFKSTYFLLKKLSKFNYLLFDIFELVFCWFFLEKSYKLQIFPNKFIFILWFCVFGVL